MTDETSDTGLAAYKRMFSEAMDLNTTTRNRSLTCERYYHKKQLTSGEIAALKRRKQPDIVINRIRPAVNGTLGVLQQGRTDPKAWPRNPDDEESADVATKTLRYIADYNDFDDIRVKVARDFLVQHAMAVIVEVDDKHRTIVNEVAPEEFFYDPRSKREDFRDARYMGVAKWVYADDVSELYPEAKGEIDRAIDSSAPIALDQSLEDRPQGCQVVWADRRRRRLMMVEIYHREKGRWWKCVFHTGGILEKGASPYQDSDAKPACPIVAQSCYVDDENVRYGTVFDMLDNQDEVNKRRSKALHLATMRQVRVSRSASIDGEDVRAELAKPDGVVVGEKDDYEILETQDMQAAHFQMMQQALMEMDRNAPNPALIGRQAGDQSGRALQTRQQAGLTELAIVFGGIETWERRVYRQMWCTAKQYMTAPDFIRITDDDGAPQFVGINQPVMGPPQVVMGENGQAAIQPTVLGYRNSIAEMDVDITLDSVPDTATLQQEQFQVLAELAKMYGPQEVPFEDMLMLSDITDKQKLLEKRRARQQEAGQQGQIGQQLQMDHAQAELADIKADVILKLAQAHATAAKPQLDGAKLQQEADRTLAANQANLASLVNDQHAMAMDHHEAMVGHANDQAANAMDHHSNMVGHLNDARQMELTHHAAMQKPPPGIGRTAAGA